MSDTVSIWVPTPQPTTARAKLAPRTALGWESARDRRCSGGRGLPPVGGPAGGALLRSRPPHPGHPPGEPLLPEGSIRRRERAARPAVRARRKATATPAIRSRPKARIIGVGESSRARKPAAVARDAVAIVGPPLIAAARAASMPARPSAPASSKRAWNWIA